MIEAIVFLFMAVSSRWTCIYLLRLEENDSTVCKVCGSKMVMIRGKYPKDPERSVCPTCAVERLESHEEQEMLRNQIPCKSDQGFGF